MDAADEANPGAELTDSALRQEIELLGALMESAAGADQPLCQADIDRALRITPTASHPTAPGDAEHGGDAP
jgi:hypothetical protein